MSSFSPSSYASSFLQAMEQLNQHYPPPAPSQIKMYPAFQSHFGAIKLPDPPASRSSIEDVASTVRGRAGISPLRQRPPSAKIRSLQSPQYYSSYEAQVMDQRMVNWKPHPLSPAELEIERWETQLLVARIAKLGAMNSGSSAKHQLRLAMITYGIYFGRIFRINDLPLEILVHIFRFVVRPVPSLSLAYRWRNTLTSVCSYWRYIALNNLTLWNVLVFSKVVVYEECFEHFKRAGNSPLDIFITDTPKEPITVGMATSLIDRLFIKLSNIRSLAVIVQHVDPALCFVRSLLRVGEQKVPMIMKRLKIKSITLQSAQIGSVHEPNVCDEPMVLFGGAHLPSLRHLSVTGFQLDWGGSVLRNLTSLEWRWIVFNKAPSLSCFRAILRNCPDLSNLALDAAGPHIQVSTQEDEVVGLEPIPLPRLRIVTLGHFSLRYSAFLFSQFTTVNVVKLELNSLHGIDPSQLFNKLAGKLPSVKSLTLHFAPQVIIPNDCPSLSEWIRSMPCLVYLRMINVSENILLPFLYDAKTLRRQSHPEDTRNPICPKLKYLEVHYFPPMRSSDLDPLPHWIHYRSSMGVPLWKLFIGQDTANEFGEDRLNRLRAAVQAARSTLYIVSYPHVPVEEKQLLGRS